MDNSVTEKDYPVENLWILKSVTGSIVAFIIAIILLVIFGFNQELRQIDFYLFIIIIFSFFHLVIAILRKSTFHYSIDKGFLTLRQGILSKQQRHIPYGVIQNLFVKQDILDRIFGLASLTIENASQGSSYIPQQKMSPFQLSMTRYRGSQIESVGFSGNRVNIPGLKKKNAKVLKRIILQRMKENPLEDNRSGL